nr:zinc finger CCCH domain-containing protein 32-like [Malus domestica]
MWQLGLTSSESYPERPGVPNCVYYMRTGFCGYGGRCRYNHPRDRAAVMATVRATGDYPEIVGEPVCEYYLKTGTCKFGASCNLWSWILKPSSPKYLWIPITTGLESVVRPLVPSPGATSLYGVTQLSSPIHGLASPYTSIPSSVGPSSSNRSEQVFPERPGELECEYYLKTGDCKYGPSCRYHHPRDRTVPRITCLLSPMDLPLRPGVQPCTFYLQNGQCKFGSTCKFDHPVQSMRCNLSASSLVDMPPVQYPVGSLLATLAPSSSSSDLRPELLSASKKDRVPSSGNTSSSSGGLIFSKSGSVSLSDVQLSSQISSPLSNSRSTRPGGEFRRSI